MGSNPVRAAAKRQAAYRALFGKALDGEAIDDIRLALTQNQPLGNKRVLDRIERMTGERREARPRGWLWIEAATGGER